MKKIALKRTLIGMLFVMAAVIFMPYQAVLAKSASAGTNYVRIDTERNEVSSYDTAAQAKKRKQKIGNQYFWFQGIVEKGVNEYAVIRYAKNASGKGKVVVNDVYISYSADAVINGRYIFYRSDSSWNIKQKDIKTGKVKTYKLPGKGYLNDYHVYKDKIFYALPSGKVRAYSMKTKKAVNVKPLKKLKKVTYMIGKNKNLYFFCEYKKKVVAYKYDIKKGKLKKLATKALTNRDGREYYGYDLYFQGTLKGKTYTWRYDFLSNKFKKVSAVY